MVLLAGVEWKTTVTGDVYTGTGYAGGYKIVNDQTIEIITATADNTKDSIVITELNLWSTLFPFLAIYGRML